MSDEATSAGGEQRKGGRLTKFKGILKRRKQFPVLLLMIVVLAIAMIYSLVTSIMS